MSEKAKIFIEDFILIVVSIVGVGFAGGAEIKHFFCFPTFPILIAIFLILFVFYFNLIFKFKQRNNINNFFEFNKCLFPKTKIVNLIFVIFYLVLSASMLAGADVLMRDVLGLNLPIVSILLSIFVYLAIQKGVDGIKRLFSKFVPIMLLIIFLNLFVNAFYLTKSFSNFACFFEIKKLNFPNIFSSIFYPILFFGSNFVLAINSIILCRKNRRKISASVLVVFGMFLMLGVATIMISKTDFAMPFLAVANNLSGVFFWIYFVSLIFSIFASLTLSTFNEFQLCNFNSNYSLVFILIVNLLASFLGFKFIIKYLYMFTGFLGIIYLIIVLIKIIKINSKNNHNYKNKN